MRILFDNPNTLSPQVSIILLDWSCRESFHVLHYLKRQSIPRDAYEIIWIEYFGRKAADIEKWLEESQNWGEPPVVDRWIVMDMPDQIYYHKHLMYNIGLIASRGTIFTICDSDAVASPTFIESIIKTFEKHQNIVLHMDELRNIEMRFYPFNYPSIEEISSTMCLNLLNGKPRGLVDKSAPLHLPNYGACFSALRDDIICIGGADEHIDYLGHICGPYEMTFRLVNAGKKELWHPKEWLFHTWHPGQSGDNNFAGPHDGRHISQTALSIRKTGRIFPQVENPAIRMLRLEQNKNSPETSLFELALSGVQYRKWQIDGTQYLKTKYWLGHSNVNMRDRKSSAHREMKNLKKEPFLLLRLTKVILLIFLRELYDTLLLARQFSHRRNTFLRPSSQNEMPLLRRGATRLSQLAHMAFRSSKRLITGTSYKIGRCQQCLLDLKSVRVQDVVLLGTGAVAETFLLLSPRYDIEVKALYDSRGKKFKGYHIHPTKALRDYRGKVIIASFEDVEKKAEMLKGLGIKPHMIVDLW